MFCTVSTHSRPKAAGSFIFAYVPFICCFNTQPPEGGWSHLLFGGRCGIRFNTQPPEGGWVSTSTCTLIRISFNTQPPEGGWGLVGKYLFTVSLFQHTAARRRLEFFDGHTDIRHRFQHTAARRRLDCPQFLNRAGSLFQHTAARRRLGCG